MALPNTDYGPERIGTLLRNVHRVYFLGIGGVSMSSLAEMTLARGMGVGGSDRCDSARLERLRRMGAEVRVGNGTAIPEGYGAVVYTVAIPPDHPEYRDAEQKGLPLISRADYLGYLTAGYRTRIGVAGMHGKSTCTAMCASILLRADDDATVLCGAELPALGGDACRIGSTRERVVFEACEYMDSFLRFRPNIAVVLNIGLDHVDYFRDMDGIRASFCRYAALVGPEGVLIRNADDLESEAAFRDVTVRTVTFSPDDPDADYRAADIRQECGRLSFTVLERGERLCEITIGAVGTHNVCNALAAIAAAREAGIDAETIAAALADFRGTSRRMERKGTLNGAEVYDDYAHHPDEIRATLAGARSLVPPGGRLICAFQPHTYSRTAGLFCEFAGAFRDADEVLLADIYAAREINESGVTSEQLARAIGEACGIPAGCPGSLEETVRALTARARPGDLLLVMGAGDIGTVFSGMPLRN